MLLNFLGFRASCVGCPFKCFPRWIVSRATACQSGVNAVPHHRHQRGADVRARAGGLVRRMMRPVQVLAAHVEAGMERQVEPIPDGLSGRAPVEFRRLFEAFSARAATGSVSPAPGSFSCASAGMMRPTCGHQCGCRTKTDCWIRRLRKRSAGTVKEHDRVLGERLVSSRLRKVIELPESARSGPFERRPARSSS